MGSIRRGRGSAADRGCIGWLVSRRERGSKVVEIQVPVVGVPGVGWRSVESFSSEAGRI